MEKSPTRGVNVACICSVLVIFAIDLATPAGIDVSVGYLAVPMLLFRRVRPVMLCGYGAVATALIAAGLLFSPPGIPVGPALLNRSLGVAVLWTAIMFLLRHRRGDKLLRANEERYRRLYKEAPVMLHAMDHAGCLLTVSSEWLDHLGYEQDEVIGRYFGEFVDPGSLPTLEGLTASCLSGHKQEVTCRLIRKDGEVIDALLNLAPEWEDHDTPTRCLAAITDITELKRTEQRRRASEAKYRRLHETLRDGYVLVAMDGTILEHNEAYREMLGYREEELARLTYADLTPPRWHELEFRIVQEQVLQNGYTEVYEKEYIRKDGSLVPVELRTYLLRDEQGNPAAMWAIVRDITERKAVENASRRIEQSYRELANSISDLFVALDEELRFTYWNRASADLTGIPASGALGKSIRDLAGESVDVEHLELRLLDVLLTRESAVFVQSFTFKGDLVSFEISAYPSQSGLVVFGKDISVRIRMEEELRRTHDDLERRVRERTEEVEKSRQELEMRNQALLLTSKELELSLDRYANLYDLAPLSYITLDAKGIIREINLTGAVMLGYDREELYGTSFVSHVRKENVRLFYGHLRRCRNNSGHVTSELYLRLDDRKLLPVLLHSVPVDGPDGDMLYRTAITDISERKLAEEKLLRLNRLYVVLSETDNAVVRASDRDDLFDEICRIAVVHGGFTLAWIGLIDFSGMVRPVAGNGGEEHDVGPLMALVRESVAGPGVVATAIGNGTYCISNDCAADPHAVPWHGVASPDVPIRAAAAVALKLNGRVIGALCLYAAEQDFFDPHFVALLQQIGADISYAIDSLDRAGRHEEAEQALRKETLERLQTVEELRKKEQLLMLQSRQAAMGEMIGNIAHQWRQPLNTIGLIVQEMPVMFDIGHFDRAYLDEKVRKAMQVIVHMSQTIDDFRKFFRPDDEKILFNVNEVVDKTIGLVDVSFREKGITIDVSAEEDIYIWGYPNEFSQVILNLLTNARDALLERRVEQPRIVLHLMTQRGKSICTITDNAGGIGEDIMGRIFEPYFTTKAVDKGTGIGLYMAKTIIDTNMNGSLTVANASDGAQFRIEV